MGLLDKLNAIATTRKTLLPPGVDPFNVVIEEIHSSTEATIGGQKVILAGTNNYLGLTFDQQCIDAGIDVILDDRNVRPGFMFADMELIGIPHRIVISDRGLEKGEIEYKGRTDDKASYIAVDNIMQHLKTVMRY